jgi:hypothetical protein
MRDCWWVITTASGREYPPVGADFFFVVVDSEASLEARVGVRSPKHPAALCVGTTGGVGVPQFLVVVAHGKEPPI